MRKFNSLLDMLLIFWWRLLDLLGAPTSVIRAPLPKELADLSPASAGLDYYDMTIDTELGGCPAWVVPCLSTSGEVSDKWIVFIHGRGGARVGVLDMLPLVNQLGYNALIITHRNDLGAPSSLDGRDHLGATEWRDLDAAIEWIVDKAEGRYVALFARSAGAQVVGQFLTCSLWGPFVDRVIFDNPVLDWGSVFLNARPKWMPKLLGRLIIWGNMRRIGVRISHFDFVKWPPIDRPPLLIIHAVNDEVCPIGVSRRFNRMRPDDWNVVLAEFPSGGHAGARFEDPARYLHLVKVWLAPDATEKQLAAPARDHEEVSA